LKTERQSASIPEPTIFPGWKETRRLSLAVGVSSKGGTYVPPKALTGWVAAKLTTLTVNCIG
jgi:hypothetical protein